MSQLASQLVGMAWPDLNPRFTLHRGYISPGAGSSGAVWGIKLRRRDLQPYIGFIERNNNRNQIIKAR